MKRIGNLYPLIAEPDNLRLAFLKAVRGKQDRSEVVRFRRDLEGNLARLRQQLLAESPGIGRYRFFTVHDPKLRQICAAPFAERVLHHAVMNVCEPVLERYAIFDSYACRPDKGARLAVARCQEFARRWPWYLKLDIRKYFDSIDHAIVLEQLARRFKDRELLHLFGNLVSQHLANFHLGEFDHWLKEDRRIKGYLRYMDDSVLFAERRDDLRGVLADITVFLRRRLRLELKDATQLNRCRQGLPFLGFRLFPEAVLLAPRSRERLGNLLEQLRGLIVQARSQALRAVDVIQTRTCCFHITSRPACSPGR